MGTGAVYCQIFDSIYPEKIQLNKINWKAKLEYEFLSNFKILQKAFSDCKIIKPIEIVKLTKAKYQHNLEFIQWMKRHYDLKHDKEMIYDPVERRGNVEIDLGFWRKKQSKFDKENEKPQKIKFQENENPQKRVKKEECIQIEKNCLI